MKELVLIQKSLKAPKGQFNKHGKFNYRSTDDILEAVKPLLLECCLTLSDDIVFIEDSMYVKSTATLINPDGQSISTTAFAKEERVNKMMSDPQRTGSTSSYSRKLALSGLFAIDDTKDSDALPPDSDKSEPKKTPKEYKIMISAAKTRSDLRNIWSTIPKEIAEELKAYANECREKLP